MIPYENTIAKITRQRCYQYNYISKWESDKKWGEVIRLLLRDRSLRVRGCYDSIMQRSMCSISVKTRKISS